jgi:hypothetical protein
MSNTTSPRTAPPNLWRIIECFVAAFIDRIGDPTTIAYREFVTLHHLRLIRRWLSAGEAFLRQLLLIEASAYRQAAPARPRTPRQRKRRLVIHDPDKPKEWRVYFRCFPAQRRPQTARKRKSPPPPSPPRDPLAPRLYSAWPLAERAEALLRVINNPARYAKRLARKLFADPKRTCVLSKRPNAAALELIGEDVFDALDTYGLLAHVHFDPEPG